MTRRIDDTLSAKVQACVLNFNAALARLCGERTRLDRDVSIAIQLAGIGREQRNMLRDMDLPPFLVAAQVAFERDLPEEIARNERYAWRVMIVHRNTNSKGTADEMVEFVKPGSETEGEIHRVLVKEMEKRKYRPTDIIEKVRARGFGKFNMHHHTILVRQRKSKDKRLPYGAYVDIGEKDWRWYEVWFSEVIEYCEQNKERFA